MLEKSFQELNWEQNRERMERAAAETAQRNGTPLPTYGSRPQTGSTVTERLGNAASWVAQDVGQALQQQPQNIRVEMPGVTVQMPQTARQQRMADYQTPSTWRFGNDPTYLETLNTILTKYANDPTTRDQKIAELTKLCGTFGNPLYSPYLTATLSASDSKSALGYFNKLAGTSFTEIDDNFINQYAYLKQYTKSNLNMSKATTEQKLAYDYNQIATAYENTKAAKQELEDLTDYIKLMASSGRNMTFEEIMKGVDLKKDYKTLYKMQEGKDTGKPIALTEAVLYNQDILYGAYWAGLNRGGSGDYRRDALSAYRGEGKNWEENKEIRDKLDPGSDSYNPYGVESTMKDQQAYFGTLSFNQKWLDDNRSYRGTTDKTGHTMYGKIVDAEANTQKAESEIADLNEKKKELLASGRDADRVMSSLLRYYNEKCPTLKKMEDSLSDGNLLNTTRAVDFQRWADIEKDVRDTMAAEAEKPTANENTKSIWQRIGDTVGGWFGIGDEKTNDDAVNQSRDNNMHAAGAVIQEAGTDAEKMVYNTAAVSNAPKLASSTRTVIDTGTTTPAQSYANLSKTATDKAAKDYFSNRKIAEEYDAQEKQNKDAKGVVKYYNQQIADLDRDWMQYYQTGKATAEETAGYQAQREALQAKQKEYQDQVDATDLWMQRNQKAYDKANKALDDIDAAVETALEVAKQTNSDYRPLLDSMKTMDAVYAFGTEYQGTQWSSTDPYTRALTQNGGDYAKTAKGVKEDKKVMAQTVEELDTMIAQAKVLGVPQEYITNMERARDSVKRDQKAADYFLVRENKDFEEKSKEASEAFQSWLMEDMAPSLMPGTAMSIYSPYHANHRMDDVMHPGWGYLTDDEKKTWYYLRQKNGEAAAEEYFNFLTDMTYGVAGVRASEGIKAETKAMAKDAPVAATAISFMTSPLQIQGTVYSLMSKITGQEINPHNGAFYAGDVTSSIREASKDKFQAMTDSPAGQFAIGLAYDAVTGAVDSTINAAITGGMGLGAGMSPIMGAFVQAVPMGLNAVGSAVQEAKMRGASDDQALLYGGISFLAETLTEAITVSNIKEARGLTGSGAKKYFETLLGDFGEEFLGESVSELIGKLDDKFVLGELGATEDRIQELMSQGATREGAEIQAFNEAMTDILYAGVVGGVSAGISTSVGWVSGDGKKNRELRRHEQELQARQEQLAGFAQESTSEGVEASRNQPVIQSRDNEHAQYNPDSVEHYLPRMGSETVDAQPVEIEVNPVEQTTEQTAEQPAEPAKLDQAPVPEVMPESGTVEAEPVDIDTLELPENRVVTREQEQQAEAESQSATVFREVDALMQAGNTEDATTAATIIAGVLQPTDATPRQHATAMAAGQMLVQKYGPKQATRHVTDLILDTNAKGQDAVSIKSMLMDATMAGVEAQEGTQGTPLERLEGAVRLADTNDPQWRNRAASTLVENRTANRVQQKIADGALNGIAGYEKAYNQAVQNVQTAETEVRQKQSEVEAAGQNQLSAHAAWNQDVNNQQLRSTFLQALQKLDGAKAVLAEYQQRLKKYQDALNDTKADYETNRDNTLTKIREEARAEVLQEMQMEDQQAAENQAIAEAAVQAAQEQEAAQQETTENQPAPQSVPRRQTESLNKSKVYVGNDTIDTHYALVDLNDLVYSHDAQTFQSNANYPNEQLQPRNRGDAVSQQQVVNIGQGLNPEKLGGSITVQEGAPIVGPDNVVESGNGRVMGIARAQQQGGQTWANYIQYLKDHAAEFGLDPNAVTPTSVLVRVRDTQMDDAARSQFTKAANQSVTMSYATSEQATVDAGLLSDTALNMLTATADGNLSGKANQQFVSQAISDLGGSVSNKGMLDTDGNLSKTGERRLQLAVFQRAYGDENLTRSIADDVDEDTRTVHKAMMAVAPRVASVANKIKNGTRYDLNVAPVVARAAEIYSTIHDADKVRAVETYLNQDSMFDNEGSNTPSAVANMLRIMAANSRSTAGITRALNAVMDVVDSYGNPNQQAITEVQHQSLEDIIEGVLAQQQKQQGGQQTTMFAIPARPMQAANGQQNAPLQATDGNGGGNNNGQNQNRNRRNDRVNSIETIGRNMVRDLGIADYLGSRNMGPGGEQAQGAYSPDKDWIAVRGRSMNSPAVMFHEIGHALGVRLGIRGSDDMVNTLVHSGTLDTTQYTDDQLRDEAFAEFFNRYMHSRDAAISYAGLAYVASFEGAVHGAGLDNVLNQYVQQARNHFNADFYAKMRSMQHGSYEKIHKRDGYNWLQRFIIKHTEDSSAFLPMGEDIQNMGKVRNHASNRVAHQFEIAITDMNDNERFEALRPQWERLGITDQAQVRGIDTLNFMLHAFEREFRGDAMIRNRTLDNLGTMSDNEIQQLANYFALRHEQYQQEEHPNTAPIITHDTPYYEQLKAIQDIMQTHPEYFEAMKIRNQWWNNLLQCWAVEAGTTPQQTLNTWQEENPYYMPTHKFGVGDGEHVAGRTGDTGYQSHAVHADTHDIISASEQFILEANVVMQNAMNNQIANSIADYIEANDDTGVWGRILSEDEWRQLSDRDIDRLGDDDFEQLTRTGRLMMDEHGNIVQRVQHIADGYNVIRAHRADGTVRYVEIHEPLLYQAILNQRDNNPSKILKGFKKVTKLKSALLTASNALFLMTNAPRDFQNSVNNGSWAGNYVTGMYRWIRAFNEIRRATSENERVHRESADWNEYTALGGGGWTQMDMYRQRSAEQTMRQLYGITHDSENVVHDRLNRFREDAVDTMTMERLNSLVEQTSRFVEYKYGRANDRSTAEGRRAAFVAAQDVTVDFSLRGSSADSDFLKSVIPFFSANVQGTYRTARLFHDAFTQQGEKSTRARIALGKQVMNTAITSAICAALCQGLMSDEDKELFKYENPDMLSKYFMIPNPLYLMGVPDSKRFIRIAISQDPLTYLVNGVVTNEMWRGTADEAVIDAATLGKTVLDTMMPIDIDWSRPEKITNTIFQPLFDIMENKTTYGGKIISNRLEDLPAEQQWNTDTPGVMISLGRLLGASPANLQYFVDQNIGVIGQMAEPWLDPKNQTFGDRAYAALKVIRNKITTDPTTSTDVLNNFYSDMNLISSLKDTASAGREATQLRNGLSQSEVNDALDMAEELLAKNGPFKNAQKIINEGYTRIEEINNSDMSLGEKQKEIDRIRQDMINAALDAQEEMDQFRARYLPVSWEINNFLNFFHVNPAPEK